MKRLLLFVFLFASLLFQDYIYGQNSFERVYDENIDPIEQINEAIKKANKEGKYVICQVGGNWCIYCLQFADYIKRNTTISDIIKKHFVYIHTNFDPQNSASLSLLIRLHFEEEEQLSFPTLVVLNEKGKVLCLEHPDSFVEDGEYDQKKILHFLNSWLPKNPSSTFKSNSKYSKSNKTKSTHVK